MLQCLVFDSNIISTRISEQNKIVQTIINNYNCIKLIKFSFGTAYFSINIIPFVEIIG